MLASLWRRRSLGGLPATPAGGVEAKLVGLAIMALLPMLVYALALIYQYAEQGRAREADYNSATAQTMAAHADTFLQDSTRLLETIAQIAALQTGDAAQSEVLLRSVLPLHPSLTNIIAARYDGTVFAAARWWDDSHPSVLYRADFRRAIVDRVAGVSDRQVAVETAEPTIGIAVPIRDSTQPGTPVVGAVLADVSLSRLQEQLTASLNQDRPVVAVTDSYGVVLVDSEQEQVGSWAYLGEHAPIRAALAGQRGAVSYQSPVDGRSWLAGYAPIAQAHWALMVASPEQLLYGKVWSLVGQTIIALVVALLLGVGLALLLATRFTRPLKRLIRATQAMAEGNLSQTVAIATHDEIAQLGDAFNRMSANLARTVTELELSHRQLRGQAERLRKVLRRTIRIQEDERRRIASDLHDSVAQLVVGALCAVQASARQASHDPVLFAQLTSATDLVKQIHAELRGAVFSLRPVILDDLGLHGAVQALVERENRLSNVAYRYELRGAPQRLPSGLATGLFRVAQEALQNIERHARATRAVVQLTFEPAEVHLFIEDDGIGVARAGVDQTPQHIGLVSMQERVESVGGTLTITTGPGAGTRVDVRVPLTPVDNGRVVRPARVEVAR